MRKDVYNRVIEEAKYLINYGSTVRETAKIFDVSKSTVHKDMRDRLPLIDNNMYNEVSSILEYHIDIKHIRGGEATKRKFLSKKIN